MQRHGLNPRARAAFALGCGFLFGLAMKLSFFRTTQTVSFEGAAQTLDTEIDGWLWFTFGAFDLAQGRFAWVANPVGLLAAVASTTGRLPVGAILGALALALGGLVPGSYRGEIWQLGPGGNPEKIVGMGLGYYLWLLVLALPVFAMALKKPR